MERLADGLSLSSLVWTDVQADNRLRLGLKVRLKLSSLVWTDMQTDLDLVHWYRLRLRLRLTLRLRLSSELVFFIEPVSHRSALFLMSE